MSYGNDYTNKPFERASKTAHTNIINDRDVQNFLSSCHIPPFEESIEHEDMTIIELKELESNPIKNIIAIDGGYTNVYVKEDFPSSTIAFFQFGALFFKYCDLLEMESKPFIDPDDYAKLNNIQRIKLVVPTKGITLGDEPDLINSVRKAVFEFFSTQPEEKGLLSALKWLLFEEYNIHSESPIWHLASCPSCCEGVDISSYDLDRESKLRCPHCKQVIYLTDVFRLHEAIDNELGAGGILGYLTTAIEQLIIVFLIKQMLTIRPGLLRETLFIKDGPLAFFGQTANVHDPMRKLITFLSESNHIYLVGLEKSGSFVEHAMQIQQNVKLNHILLLGNRYIYKYIIPGSPSDSAPYGRSTYYGHKLIFKSNNDNVYVATIPGIKAKSEPDMSDYLNIHIVLNNVAALKCDLYSSSLVPIVLANKLVSLADHPSADLLKSFAQSRITNH